MSAIPRAGGRHPARPRRKDGRLLRAGIYRERGPWNPSPLAGLWVVPAAAKIGVVALIVGTTFLVTSPGVTSYIDGLPDVRVIAAVPMTEDTLIYASDGTTLLADIHPSGHQQYYEPLSAMGVYLPMAAVAIEDHNFYSEPGVDPGAVLRAAAVDLRAGSPVEGASTITQQLVKLTLVGNQPSLSRKVEEALLAVEVERTYSKRQILEMYLNTVFFGNDAYGSAAAAKIYFHTTTAKLDLAQAAMLAGLLRDPTYSNSFYDASVAKARQGQVLDAMVRAKMVTAAQAAAALAEDLSAPNHIFLPANVILDPGFVSYVTDELVSRFGSAVTYGGGLRVVTTLDWAMTQKAQQLIQAQVSRYSWGNVHQGAMVAIDPHSGAILAMVGSADPNANGGQYNFAVWPPRNPGSSMKIYTYTEAIASGKFTMVSPVPDQRISISQGVGQPLYTPANYDGRLHGTCQLQACFLNSLNIPAVRVELGLPNGPADVAQMARTMGAPPWHCADPPACQHFTDNDPLSSYGASLTLGGWGETPLQMATGASVLAAQGVLHQPTSLASITTADGHPFYKLDPSSGAKQVVDPRVAYIVEQMMSDDRNRAMIFGLGSNLTLPDHKVASKTGTTDDYRDGWTLGYTPAVATAFWFGNANFSPMAQYLEASVIAAPVWHAFMEWTLNVDLKRPGNEWFAQPPGLLEHTVAGRLQWFMPGTTPYQATPQPQGVVVRRKKT
ncbi:MAG TPA: transglycosylase domain-containing protein [Candidatus Baltobacterales bacterium]|nr:transglycosylase domain-containing protein [Candidatus Baltobacterales bacterium]